EQPLAALEGKLLEPVYSAYPWSPELTKGPKAGVRNRFEQALFARTAATETLLDVGLEDDPRRWERRDGEAAEGARDSLGGSTFRGKGRRVAESRDGGLTAVGIAWGMLILLVLLLGYIAIWLSCKTEAVVVGHVLGLFAMLGCAVLVVLCAGGCGGSGSTG